MKLTAVVAILVSVAGTLEKSRGDAEASKRRQFEQDLAATQRFRDNIESTYESLTKAVAAGETARAVSLLDDFHKHGQMTYRDVEAINAQVRTQHLLAELERIPESKASERLASFVALARLNPGNAEYEERKRQYAEQLADEARARELAEAERRVRKRTGLAFVMIQDHVRSLLKCPSTAEFPVLKSRTVHLGDQVYRVQGVVDAENSFGAMIRNRFEGEIQQVGEAWVLRHVRLLEP